MKKQKKFLRWWNNKNFLLLILLISFIVISCSSNWNENGNLNSIKIVTEDESNSIDLENCKIEELTYVDDDDSLNKHIRIAYPEIEDVANNEITQKVNRDVKELALAVLGEFTSFDGMDIETTYSTSICNKNIFSVCFIIRTFHEIQAYPLIRYKTLNVNMNTGEKIKLKDVVNINDNFFNMFFDRFEYFTDDDLNVDDEKIINEYVKKHLTKESLTTCDELNNLDYYSYLTKDSLIVVIAVPFSYGSYASFKAKFADIKEFLKNEFKNDI